MLVSAVLEEGCSISFKGTFDNSKQIWSVSSVVENVGYMVLLSNIASIDIIVYSNNSIVWKSVKKPRRTCNISDHSYWSHPLLKYKIQKINQTNQKYMNQVYKSKQLICWKRKEGQVDLCRTQQRSSITIYIHHYCACSTSP